MDAFVAAGLVNELILVVEPVLFGSGLPLLSADVERGLMGAMIEQVHAIAMSDPLVAGNWFACAMKLEVAIKGQGGMTLDELCIYEVDAGKIVSERFTSRLRL
jgi:hypothetical protein